MNKKNNFLLIGFIFIYLLTYLVPSFVALPYTPGHEFYNPFWLIILMFFLPEIYFKKIFHLSFLFIYIHIFYIFFDVYGKVENEEYFVPLGTYFYTLFIPISFLWFTTIKLKFRYIQFLYKFILGAITTTTITSILVLLVFPEASRTISSSSTETEIHLFFMTLNTGGYVFAYSIALLSPIYYFFYTKNKNYFWIVLFFLSIIYLFLSQLVGAIIIFLINVSLVVIFNTFKVKSIRGYLLSILGFVLIFNIFKKLFGEIILMASNYFIDYNQIYIKSREIAQILIEGVVDESSKNILIYRELKDFSIDLFLASPIFGGSIPGGHQFWIDYLARFGVVGLVPYILLVIYFVNFVKTCLNSELFIIFLHCLFMFVYIGVEKNIVSSMPFIIFFIIPFVLFHENYKKD